MKTEKMETLLLTVEDSGSVFEAQAQVGETFALPWLTLALQLLGKLYQFEGSSKASWAWKPALVQRPQGHWASSLPFLLYHSPTPWYVHLEESVHGPLPLPLWARVCIPLGK